MAVVSIILPSYNEGNNVNTITQRIQKVLSKTAIEYEIWFIDDSKDNTPELLAELVKENPHVNYLHRQNTRGLGQAVVKGFEQARGEYFVVMDADLQHPPELLPLMIHHLIHDSDIVIPSRFIEGGSDGGLNIFRKLISYVARKIGQVLIKQFRSISDCTSGYFGLRREVIEGVSLDPTSWKILMEILVKGRYKTVHEIPYHFMARSMGESKMSLKEQWNYLKHIFKLRKIKKDPSLRA